MRSVVNFIRKENTGKFPGVNIPVCSPCQVFFGYLFGFGFRIKLRQAVSDEFEFCRNIDYHLARSIKCKSAHTFASN